jgi:hypothetical protein
LENFFLFGIFEGFLFRSSLAYILSAIFNKWDLFFFSGFCSFSLISNNKDSFIIFPSFKTWVILFDNSFMLFFILFLDFFSIWEFWLISLLSSNFNFIELSFLFKFNFLDLLDEFILHEIEWLNEVLLNLFLSDWFVEIVFNWFFIFEKFLWDAELLFSISNKISLKFSCKFNVFSSLL